MKKITMSHGCCRHCAAVRRFLQQLKTLKAKQIQQIIITNANKTHSESANLRQVSCNLTLTLTYL